jgi:diguanylate cyclase (GGDEF)-like protein
VLRRVAAIIQDHIEEIVQAWVQDLRETPHTEIHNEMLSGQIVDGMKAMLDNVAATIALGVAPDVETAEAATVVEQISPRAAVMNAVVVTAPEILPAPLHRVPSRHSGGRVPASVGRQLYRSRAVSHHRGRRVTQGDSLRRALAGAEHTGRLRQRQGYTINEVVQEYIHLRRRFWRTLSGKLRRSDRPAVELAIYIDGILDNLLTTSVQAYQEAAVHDLEQRAVRDPLTGLYNHNYCWERLHEEVRHCQRTDRPFTVVLFDLDRLKAINDTYGHQTGDRALAHVATAMRAAARASDILCRYAGDEFVLILPGTAREEALTVVERLRAEVRRPVAPVRPTGAAPADPLPAAVLPTISVGLATCPDDGRQAEILIAQADTALYRAKAAGRDRVA